MKGRWKLNENPTSEQLLEQSIELNNIQADMLREKQKSSRVPWIALVVVSFIMAAIVITSFWFFSQYEFYTETTTVTQDTTDGGGNNNYFNADGTTYNEASVEEGEMSLHILMENRKHAKRLMEEKHGTAPMMGESMGHMAEGNPHHMATAKNPY